MAHVLMLFPPQPKQSYTPQLTPRRPLLADQRSSLIFESCETISITSLGKTPLTQPHMRNQSTAHLKTCFMCTNQTV